MKDKTTYLVISESKIGIHSKFPDENFEVIPMNFMPNVIKENDLFLPRSNLQNNKDFKYIVKKFELLKKQDNTNVFLILGFDLDPKGEMMAQSLSHQLKLHAGIEEEEIHRMALSEHGYILTEPLDINDYCKFYYLQKKFIDSQGTEKINIRTLLSIITLNQKKEQKLNLENMEHIDVEGTNTFTALYYLMNKTRIVE